MAQPISILMLDVDYFKPFNDNYGHGLGDECLVQVAKTMTHELKRPNDLLARYGGEEFVVLLPETPLAGAIKVAEDLRAAVEALNFPHKYSAVADHVTISVGVASNEVSQESAVDELLKRADAALYQAKAAGRNRVSVG